MRIVLGLMLVRITCSTAPDRTADAIGIWNVSQLLSMNVYPHSFTVRRTGGRLKELILDISEQYPDGRVLRRHLILGDSASILKLEAKQVVRRKEETS